MTTTKTRHIDPEDALCIDYTPTYPLPGLPSAARPFAALLLILRRDLARFEAEIAAGRLQGIDDRTGQPEGHLYVDSIARVRSQIAKIEAM